MTVEDVMDDLPWVAPDDAKHITSVALPVSDGFLTRQITLNSPVNSERLREALR